jgi:hypothetical protein
MLKAIGVEESLCKIGCLSSLTELFGTVVDLKLYKLPHQVCSPHTSGDGPEPIRKVDYQIYDRNQVISAA